MVLVQKQILKQEQLVFPVLHCGTVQPIVRLFHVSFLFLSFLFSALCLLQVQVVYVLQVIPYKAFFTANVFENVAIESALSKASVPSSKLSLNLRSWLKIVNFSRGTI